MPIPALVAAGVAAASQGANMYAQGRMNRKTREWNEKMYNQQRQHALDDWNMQNQYNSPQAQMARLQEAGLNPAMAAGSTGNTSESVQQPHVMPYKPSAPTIDIPSIVDGYFDVKMKQASINNMNKQGDILALEAAAKATQNQFLSNTLGFRTNFEKQKAKSMYEDATAKAARYIRDTGFMSPNLEGGISDFAPDSNYSLQLKGMALGNALRDKEGANKDVQLDINKQRRDYDRRMLGGDLTNLTWQDWLKLALQQIKPR